MSHARPPRRSVRTFLPLLTLILASTGCGDDAVAPGPDVTLELTAETHVLPVVDQTPAYLSCNVTLRIRAAGDPEAVAEWEEVTLDLEWGPPGGGGSSSWEFPGGDMAVWVGSTGLAPGEDAWVAFSLESDIPFRGVWQQAYRVVPGDAIKRADAPFQCGATDTTAAQPHSLLLEPGSGAEAGSLIDVTYSATVPAGVWTAVLQVGDQEGQPLGITPWATTIGGSASVGLPLGPLGEPVAVTLTVTDVLGRAVELRVPAGPLTDTSAPRGIIHALNSFATAPVGSTMQLTLRSQDASVHWLVLAVGQPAVATDSIRFEPGDRLELAELEIPADWVGEHPLTGWFADTLGHTTAAVHIADLLIYPRVESSYTTTEVPGAVTDVRLDPARDLLYLARPGHGELARLAVHDLATLAPIPLPSPVRSVDLTLSGDSLVAVGPGLRAVLIIDPMRVRPVEEYPLDLLEEGFEPQSVRVAGDGQWIVHAERRRSGDGYARDVALVRVDPATGSRTLLAAGELPFEGATVTASRDRGRMVVQPGCPRVYDLADGFRPCWSTPAPLHVVADPTGSAFASGSNLFGPDGELLRQGLPVPYQSGYAVSFTPSGEELLVAQHRGLHTVDVQTWRPTAFRDFPDLPGPGGLLVSEGGDLAIYWGQDYPVTLVVRLELGG